jgi:2-dehydro-3-deoxygluconokinase
MAEAELKRRRHGTVVSYDLNFRPSLWAQAEVPAADVNRQLVQHADVVIGNEEDYSAALGYPLDGASADLRDLDISAYDRLLARVLADFPGLTIAAATLRQVQTASVNDWSGVCRTRTAFHEGPWMAGLEIFDRIGGPKTRRWPRSPRCAAWPRASPRA